AMVQPRYAHASTVIGNSVYVIGGGPSAAVPPLLSVERATIDDDGSLEMFANVSNVSLMVGRRSPASAVIGNHIYVMSGNGLTVERAPISGNGLLGTFEDAKIALKTLRQFAVAAVVGKWVYVIGGFNGNALGTVEQAPIAADGTVGAFAV